VSHTYSQVVIHVVFSTKDRRKTIGKEFAPKLHAYVAGICKNEDVFSHAIGGAEDHLHMLIQVPATVSVAKAVGTIKANSSRWAKESRCELSWQQGYGAFSVSTSAIPSVARYIRNQETHHRRMSFEDEYRALLKKHRIEFDPRFVFG
jgi:REP element-mobilizing transposase RayT